LELLSHKATFTTSNPRKECNVDLKTLIDEEERIRSRVKDEYVDPTGNTEPIYDGVADLEGYLASSPRIMWILKEPYDDFKEDGTPIGGGWSYATDHPFNKDIHSTSRARVFQPICYINYGIWTGQGWDQMPWLSECQEMRHGLRKIAYINVSKMPALKSSEDPRIEEAYRRHRDLILDQINTYAPNILFACAPHAHLLLKEFGRSEAQWKHIGSAAAIQVLPERRLVWVWHPSQRNSAKRVDYVNDAIKAATVDLT
jgi:hypothetical protein